MYTPFSGIKLLIRMSWIEVRTLAMLGPSDGQGMDKAWTFGIGSHQFPVRDLRVCERLNS